MPRSQAESISSSQAASTCASVSGTAPGPPGRRRPPPPSRRRRSRARQTIGVSSRNSTSAAEARPVRTFPESSQDSSPAPPALSGRSPQSPVRRSFASQSGLADGSWTGALACGSTVGWVVGWVAGEEVGSE